MKTPHIYLSESIWMARSAVLVSAFLCWYAAWTIECTSLVLLGASYHWLLIAPLPATIIMIIFLKRHSKYIATAYSRYSLSTFRDNSFNKLDLFALSGATLLSLAAADIGNRIPTSIPYIAATSLTTLIVFLIKKKTKANCPEIALVQNDSDLAKQGAVALLGLFLFYYFAHKPDADDANFVNLAIGAKRTVGGIFQYDSMIGDGQSLIHLPTYKFHSFELLCAVISTYLGVQPIYIFHLLVPAGLLVLLDAVLILLLYPVLGRYWLAGVILWMTVLVINIGSLGGWGVHGVTRFFEGKGFYVTALLPLIAAISLRWMRRGEKSDLVALALGQVCVIGFSANGIYGGPAASGLVVLASVIASPLDKNSWFRAIGIVPTLTWPAIVASLIMLLHLAYPSEVTAPTIAIEQLNLDGAFGIVGRMLLVALALSAFGLWRAGLGVTGIVYVSAAIALIMNDYSWRLISIITGNLGFRIFWSIPLPIIVSITTISLIRHFTKLPPRATILLSLFMLFAALLYNSTMPLISRIAWHLPDLKVDRPDYDLAKRLADQTFPGCAILAPERYSALISMMENAPYPVFVRELYLIHYRFTLPPVEIAYREVLRRLVDGRGAAVPSATELANHGISIGTVAIQRDAPSHASAVMLAKGLRLTHHYREGTLDVWSGVCGRLSNNDGINKFSNKDKPFVIVRQVPETL